MVAKSLFSRFQSAQLGLIFSADGGDASNSLSASQEAGGLGEAEDFAGLMLIVVRANLRTRKPVSSGAQERMHTRCPLLCPPRVPAGGDKSRRRAASFCSAGICSALPCERAAKSNPRLILCFEPGYLQAFELRVLRRSSWV